MRQSRVGVAPAVGNESNEDPRMIEANSRYYRLYIFYSTTSKIFSILQTYCFACLEISKHIIHLQVHLSVYFDILVEEPVSFVLLRLLTYCVAFFWCNFICKCSAMAK